MNPRRLGWLPVAAGAAAWLWTLTACLLGRVPGERLIGSVPVLALFVAGAIAWARRPGHGSARRLLATGVLASAVTGLGAVASGAALPGGGVLEWLVAVAGTAAGDLALAALLDLFCSFPDGRYPSDWARRLARAGYAVALGSAVLTVLHPRLALPLSSDPPVRTPSPLHGPLIDLIGTWPTLDSWLFGYLLVAVAVLLLRYRRANTQIRAKLRWPMAGVGVLALVVLTSWMGVLSVLLPLEGVAAQVAWALALSAVPAGLLVGIVRNRVFDLDLSLGRWSSLAVLWVLITGIYAALAAVPGVSVGSRVPLRVASVLTIAVATAFQPARRWLERQADRGIFGDRLGGYVLIRQFGATLESAVPEAELAPRLAQIVRSGLSCRWVRVRVLPEHGSGGELLALSGEPEPGSEPVLVAEMSAGGEALGRLECGPRSHGEHVPEDAEVLHTLAAQAALGLANSRLQEQNRQRMVRLDEQARELAASRARLIAAESAARRQLERDIHDGVQQQLISLMTKLSVALAQLEAGSPRVRATLETMQREFRCAVRELRDLAGGIHPAVLTDQGLGAAIVALAARLTLPVSIDCPNGADRQLDQQVEIAAYFGVAEALTNVLKHAQASHAWVCLRRASDALDVEIRDNGRGFDVARTAARGLAGLRDRIEAAEGALVVSSTTGGPTVVRMHLPAGAMTGAQP